MKHILIICILILSACNQTKKRNWTNSENRYGLYYERESIGYYFEYGFRNGYCTYGICLF